MIRPLLILVLLPSLLFGQKQGNVWYFGEGNGLDFNTVPPTLLTDGQTSSGLACGDWHIEGTASIADSSGNLLFYSDGRSVWNENHQVIANGTGLLGGVSSTQAALIVPEPESDTRFYIFTTDDFCNDLVNGLRYSIVDVCGIGEQEASVLPEFKNILLEDTIAEKLAVVRHTNGEDYWVVTHKYFSDEFYAYPLTTQGIGMPTISAIGSVHQGGGTNNMWRAIGQLKISPNGDKLAIGAINGAGLCEVFDFDNSTGIVSNGISINSLTGAYGLAFSPNGLLLYETPLLTQYNLTAGNGNQDSVSASAFQYSDPQLSAFDGIELGPDGKIYLYDSDNTIAVIHSPNELGEQSMAQPLEYSMSTSERVFGFPSFVAGFDYSSSGICDTGVGIEETVVGLSELTIYPNPATTQSQLTYRTPQGGQPTLLLTDMLGCVVHTAQLPSHKGTYTLDASTLGAGVYFCTLLNGTEVLATQKLVVVNK